MKGKMMSGWVDAEKLKHRIFGGLDNQLKYLEEEMRELNKRPYSKNILKRIELKKRINEIKQLTEQDNE